MQKQELLSFCSEKNILLDGNLLEIFSKISDTESLKIFLESLKESTSKSFFNKSFISSNRDLILKLFTNSFYDKEYFQDLKISLGLDKQTEKSFSKKVEKSFSKVKIVSNSFGFGKSLEVKDFVLHFRNRYNSFKKILENREGLENLISVNKLSSDKQKFSVIGMVSDKRVTKNDNILLEVEDLTGRFKVLINSNKEKLVEEAQDITLDAVLGFEGVGNKDILFANKIIFPEVVLPERKKGPVEEYALFTGDLHFGSKNFLEEDFLRFIEYLKGNESNREETDKIKYLFLVGDLVTGIGNYPNQEFDLKVGDLEEQFSQLANLLNQIPKHIKIIITPGNHDGVRLMEPQPFLNEKYAWPLYELENVVVAENPSVVNIGATETFSGFDVLVYHGFSFPYYANTIPKLMVENTMNEPEKIMKYLLKNSHLAPTHASTQYFPSEKDGMMINKAPDIFLSGHTHKSGVTYYNNVLVVSSSSWEGKTAYQEKFGNEPDHCKVPMLNLKTRVIKILDFETNNKSEEGAKK